MNQIIVDSNVILDLFLDDQDWADWSESILSRYSQTHHLCINPIIYSEVSVGFKKIEELESALTAGRFRFLQLSKEALFLAGKAFLKYRSRMGTKTSTLPDFFIGAHAAVLQIDLITRDVSRFRSYFPTINLITPRSS
ncbi:PIN domain-containing protein [bacterium]|nr:PIN domain-containing protein [bacterium]